MDDQEGATRSKIVAFLGLALGFVGAVLSGASRDPIVIIAAVLIFYFAIRYGFNKVYLWFSRMMKDASGWFAKSCLNL
jgi:hypothetical protein